MEKKWYSAWCEPCRYSWVVTLTDEEVEQALSDKKVIVCGKCLGLRGFGSTFEGRPVALPDWWWNFSAQKWQHLPCGAEALVGSHEPPFCPKCEVRNPEVRTVGDLMELVQRHALDADEYFSPHDWQGVTLRDRGQVLRDPLWLKNTKWIAVFWVVGGSEGYYVHVERVQSPEAHGPATIQDIALGKFWDRERAAFATGLVQLWINSQGEIEPERDYEMVPHGSSGYGTVPRCTSCGLIYPEFKYDLYPHCGEPCPNGHCPTHRKEAPGA
jgi:hypothetical protein